MKTGRPMKEIDQKNFESLCGLQCTLPEIADFFECSEDTIQRWCKRTYKETFAVVYNKRRGRGLISLRRAQFNLAEKSAAMAIFLGKQYLGQKDSPVDETAANDEYDKHMATLADRINKPDANRNIDDFEDGDQDG